MRKRILSFLMTFIMIISLFPVSAFAATGASDLSVTIDTGASVTLKDTDSDGYYEIGTADELYAFAALINGGESSINGELTADITVNSNVLNEDGTLNGTPSRAWTPIGYSPIDVYNVAYEGTFDGNDKAISGLYYDGSYTYYVVGLFGYVYGGTVKNVTVADSYFCGYIHVGGVVGYCPYGTVTNCTNSGTVSGNENVGGIVGYSGDTVSGCTNSGDVSGESCVGGIVGDNRGTVTNCTNDGTVSGKSHVGGIVGYDHRGTVSGCTNSGTVSGASCVGGIEGFGSFVTVSGCTNSGDVSGESYVGGITGDGYYSTVTNCTNDGTVSGKSEVGGIAGYYGYDGTVSGCTNSGDVSGESKVGGIVGEIEIDTNSEVENCYNIATVSGNEFVGPVVGNDEGTMNNCYYLSDSDNNTDTAAKTSDQFASGEVAYLLQGDQTEHIWGQTIGTDAFPVLGGTKVYFGYVSCDDAEGVYSNSVLSAEKPDHNYVNGQCTACGAADPFVDVAKKDYFYEPVLWAVEKGITGGIDATHFAPNNPCTRGQVVTFLWRANGSPEPQSSYNPFSDISADKYYYKAVLWAVENGITSGLNATTFGPNNACTRGQIATFLWRANGSPEPQSSNNPFSDVNAGPFYKAILWAVEEGITTGYAGGTFRPGNVCTRGNIVTFLYRAYN